MKKHIIIGIKNNKNYIELSIYPDKYFNIVNTDLIELEFVKYILKYLILMDLMNPFE